MNDLVVHVNVMHLSQIKYVAYELNQLNATVGTLCQAYLHNVNISTSSK